jgi:hypothetical protein
MQPLDAVPAQAEDPNNRSSKERQVWSSAAGEPTPAAPSVCVCALCLGTALLQLQPAGPHRSAVSRAREPPGKARGSSSSLSASQRPCSHPSIHPSIHPSTGCLCIQRARSCLADDSCERSSFSTGAGRRRRRASRPTQVRLTRAGGMLLVLGGSPLPFPLSPPDWRRPITTQAVLQSRGRGSRAEALAVRACSRCASDAVADSPRVCTTAGPCFPAPSRANCARPWVYPVRFSVSGGPWRGGRTRPRLRQGLFSCQHDDGGRLWGPDAVFPHA